MLVATPIEFTVLRRALRLRQHLSLLGGRPIGRTSGSGSDYPGSSPGLPANFIELFLIDYVGGKAPTSADKRLQRKAKDFVVLGEACPRTAGPSLAPTARVSFRGDLREKVGCDPL